MVPIMKYQITTVYETHSYIVTAIDDGMSTYYLIGAKENKLPIFRTILQRLRNEIGTHIFTDKGQAIAIADKAQKEYDYTVSAM